ncbi:uncharacterized protein EKO05_0001695 [Ascochyta rabiei]|uniref:uncharacterized protein n=1 Tax=Didymella rabiei TaxID=5454 RepID=UPI002209A760|nr:uncharacterized protein EKO05_0001695 [Ascochyta rabiei]UPX11071.1 hypothetical protein EKO05_0001695 [Ascochyta rabiei]
MRLSIESRNRWTIEIVSSKHDKLDRKSAHTFVSNTSIKDNADRSEDTSLSFSRDTTNSFRTFDTSVHRYAQLPRRKSIHGQIGRFFLRISRMYSDTQYDAYAYQYGHGASELPAGGPPIEGSTSFQEMPGSFPPDGIFELEDVQRQDIQCCSKSTRFAQMAPYHLQDYFTSNQNATMRKPAPIPVTNLPQLPRLEVPKSQHCVPRLMSDLCSVTPSPISPITPVLNTNGVPNQNQDSQKFLDTISPCTNPKQAHIFAHYGSWEQYTQHPPATPSTISSYGPSNSTTPLSAHPSSGHSSFHAWTQAQDGQLPPTYSQDYLPVSYDQSMANVMTAGTSSWKSTGNSHSHLHDHSFLVALKQEPQRNAAMDSRQYGSFSYTPNHDETRSQLSTTHLQPMVPQPRHAYNDAPPDYSPVVPDHQLCQNLPKRFPPAPCQRCEKVFTGKFGPGNLKRHVRQTHESMFEKVIHVCKTCLKTYNRADALRKHSWKKHRQEDARPNKRRK